MKVISSYEERVNSTLPLTARVQKGLKLVEKGRLQRTPSWGGEDLTVLDEETIKLPLVKRKALAIRKVLTEMPVEVKENELLVGSVFFIRSSRQHASCSAPFVRYATQDEKKAANKNFVGTGSMFGHFSPYYPRLLKLGVGGLRRMAEEKLDEVKKKGTEPEKEAWLESIIISLDALRDYIQRHRDLALSLADKEADAARKGELQEVARVSQHLLVGPPRSFREALQAFWIGYVALFCTLDPSPLGRFDQNLWPYLKADLENGAITIEDAQELIDCLWLKFNERLESFPLTGAGLSWRDSSAPIDEKMDGFGAACVFLGGKTTQDRFIYDGGLVGQYLASMTLGGLTPEGLDGTNPLTYLCLNALFRLKTPEPSLYLRLHDGSPAELYRKAADCIRAGCIGPCIYNDELIIPSLMKMGITAEDARDYTSDGCFEIHIQGRTDFRHGWVSAAEVLDRVLYPGKWEKVEVPLYVEAMDPFRDMKAVDPYSFNTFDELMQTFKELLDKNVRGFIEQSDKFRDGRLYKIAPLPLLSAFLEGPLESGKDITQGGAKYTFHMIEMAGLSHVADSLAVIKKLCFEEKVIAWPKLLGAIRNDWRGKESMRQLVMTRVPAYGNDADYVDDIATDIAQFFVASMRKHNAKVKHNIKYLAGLATYQHYIMLGKLIDATPDGRFAGDSLSTNASPSIGRPTNGQSATVNSYAKLPLVDLTGGAMLDIDIETRPELLSHLEKFIKSFVEIRGQMISITVTSSETLRAAQREPEKYRDLRVRVGGDCAYFVDLPRSHQDMQIKRCEQYER